MTYRPEWDIDREYGEEGEESVKQLLGLSGVDFEVKRKRRLDDMFYVEVAQCPDGGVFKKSGVNTTTARYWAYAIGDSGIVIFVPTGLLKRAALAAPEVSETDGNNPTKGRLVRFAALLKAAA